MRCALSSVLSINPSPRTTAAYFHRGFGSLLSCTITRGRAACHQNRAKINIDIQAKEKGVAFSSLQNFVGVSGQRPYHSRVGCVCVVGQRIGFPSAIPGNNTAFTTHTMSTDDPVVSVEWLHSNIQEPDIKVLDASWYMPDDQRNPLQEYQVAHIPGALFFDVDGISNRTTNLPHMLPSEVAFAAAVTSLGIENKDGIIVYDGKGIFSAARVWWMFRIFGHVRVWVLDGGLPRWRASCFDVESSASGDAILKASAATEVVEKFYQNHAVGPSKFQTKFQPHLVWTLDQVKQNIDDKTHQHIDARSKSRFNGTAPEPRKGIKSGHVPRSVCIPFMQMLDTSQMLLPAEELEKRLINEGISLDRPAVTSCGTGITACIIALGLHRLGRMDVAVYDGSWTEWGSQPDTPISNST